MNGDTLCQISAEKRFELFLESATDYAIFFTDPTGVITEWNTGAEKIIGYTAQEAVGQPMNLIFTREDRAEGASEAERSTAARDGQAVDERWHLHKDQSRFFAVGRLIALKSDVGHVFGFAKVLRDVTPYKSLEEALRLSEQQFRAIFAQAPMGMALSDLDGRILQANATFGELVGLNAKELIGRPLLSFVAEPERTEVAEEIRRLFLAEKASFLIEKRLVRADGSQVWVQNSGAILRDDKGQSLSLIDLSQDITALKMSRHELEMLVAGRTSALEDKSRQMEAFCYTVAHDLRAPLRAIAGYAEFLRLDHGASFGPEPLVYLQKIEESAARLDRLIHDLLGYTRVQQIPLQPESIDVTPIVDRVVDDLQREIRLSGAVINTHTPLDMVKADAATLEPIF
ncbi:MAG: hypothetical protein RIQ93_2589, partial [Verrucomicrobiota bacterium]